MKLTNKLILAIILIVAGALRFWDFTQIPFMHDEFSALFRLDFNSFSELIDKGVKVDGHPAGVQVFLYYWTMCFGRSEWVVKLPFILAGVACVYLVYVVAKKWGNETVGLICAAFMATIQYTIMYSQIARPYISGLFFSLLMVNYWSSLVKNPEKQFYRNAGLFVLSAAACAYNHYFSLLFAAIAGISGIFMINRAYLTRYILAGVAIILLFLPHLRLFIYQLNIGGVGGWLAKPQNDYLPEYIAYAFHFSYWSLVPVAGLLLFGFYQKDRGPINYRYYLLFGSWFLLPFLIGFFYSRYVNAVLQYSVLIFSFPYFLFILFGHIRAQKPLVNLVIIFTIATINITTLIVTRQHYSVFYQSHYRHLLTDHEDARDQRPNVLSVIHSHKKISAYYIKKLGIDTSFTWYNGFENDRAFKAWLDTQNAGYNYFYLGALSSNNPNTVPIIMEYYPEMVWKKSYALGTTYLFSKRKKTSWRVISALDFTDIPPAWTGVDLVKHQYADPVTGPAYRMDSSMEYGPTFSERLDKITQDHYHFIDISVQVKNLDNPDDIELVASLESRGENKWWGAVPFRDFFLDGHNRDEWTIVHNAVKLSDIYLDHPDLTLKVFIWNRAKRTFLIDHMEIKLRVGNPVIYGLGSRIK